MKFTDHRYDNNLGVSWAPAAASVASALLGPKKSAAKPGVAAPTAPTTTTVSPAFQQSFTPQFSPTMQQQQDSPGATQAASPTQVATPSQAARTAAPGGPGSPSYGREPMGTRPSSVPQLPTMPSYRPVMQKDNQMAQLMKWGIIGIIGITAMNAYQKKNGKKKSKGSKSKPRDITGTAVRLA